MHNCGIHGFSVSARLYLQRLTVLNASILLLFVAVCAPHGFAQRAASAPGAQVSQPGPETSRRVVKFRTQEGTWISLDVSPDGRAIVFSLLGDLYTLPIAGGRAEPLTSGMAWDDQPRFSPDGRHVAFISDRSGILNLWIIDSDGKNPRQLSEVLNNTSASPICSPAWSPDGKSIVVSQRPGAFHIDPNDVSIARFHWLLAAYEVETGRMRWLGDATAGNARVALGPTFDPGGHTIYAAFRPYVPARELTQSASAASAALARLDRYNFWRIERMDLDTGSIFPVLAPSLGRGGIRPVTSRDGRYLAYVSSSGSGLGLRLLDLHALKERWLIQETMDGLQASANDQEDRDLAPGYAFTPDSKALVVAFNGKIHRIEIANGEISIVPFVVDVERELLPMKVYQFTLPDNGARIRGIMQPALSPEGKKVVFSALSRLWVMGVPEKGESPQVPKRLTADSVGEFYPSWSPDGQWIAYSTWEDGKGGAVRRIRVGTNGEGANTSPEILTKEPALYFHTAFSPDGKRIALVRADMSLKGVLLGANWAPKDVTLNSIPATGGALQRIASLDAPRGQPSRNPVEQVYFTDDPDHVHVGLRSWKLDGSGGAVSLDVFDDSWATLGMMNDVSGMMAPNGRRALITHRQTLSEVLLPSSSEKKAGAFNVEEAQLRPFGSDAGSASLWGAALAPWFSWSRDGKRALFSQGGTIFIGDVQPSGWTSFRRVDVPLTIQRDEPHGAVMLKGARLITMRGEEVLEKGDLLVQDGRIVTVGTAGKVDIPSDAKVIDVSGKTILPGYVDIHDHFSIPAGLHSAQVPEFLVRLAYGVTAFRDPYETQNRYNDMFAYQDLERAGQLLSPRVFSTGIAHLSRMPVKDLKQAMEVLHPTADYLDAETFKEYSYDATQPERQLISQAALQSGINATPHSNGGIHWLTTAIYGYSGVEHSYGSRFYDDVATLIAKSGTTSTNTYILDIGAVNYVIRHDDTAEHLKRFNRFLPPVVRAQRWDMIRRSYEANGGTPTIEEFLPELQDAALVAARGGHVGMGAHGNILGIGFHYEMWLHALGGMPNHDILRSATIVGATAIGHANDFGSLERGKFADLQVLDKNPLEDIHNTMSVRYVMKNGRLYQADDLTETWPRQKPLDPIYLWP